MRTRTAAAAVAAAAIAVSVAACSPSEEASTETHDMSSMSSSQHASESASQDAGEHNAADVMFAQMMLPHHEQALVMSDIILGKKDIPESVTTLATQIKDAQGPEIAQLKAWLKGWGEPEHQEMDHEMDGMLSEEELDELRAAEGTEAAKMFLTQMIEHHEGAVTMAEDEIEDGRHADSITMSKAIVESQQKEIDQMKALLKEL
ncbi:DUF305 domain-containing protein [Gordonia shandongensis]|uniref:DUF305 domain-containing protein n=1 Tax=Gordonia shandongensis TaxID=376351 RepID=UPI00041BA8DA|nr:DUF305 domain-containing protein [Gordonia shandongensis]